MTEISNAYQLENRAKELLRETKLLQITKSANIVIDIFGMQKAFDRVKEREGQEIEMYFPALDGSITFTLVSDYRKFDVRCRTPTDPTARIIMNVKENDILQLISDIMTLKDNLFGLMRMVPKLLTRKIKIKGSLISAIILCRCMMIGKHEMYKGQL